jgi:transcriptional regulator with XRE-family HTH domain
LTLDQVYSASGLSTRFLSEFERGKPNASLGRVMDALQALGLEMTFPPWGSQFG